MSEKSPIQGSRLLRTLIPATGFATDTNSVPTFMAGQQGGWEIVNPQAGAFFAVWRGYFDLSGYEAEDLTTVVTGGGFQESDEYRIDGTIGALGGLKVWDIISKNRIPDSALDQSKFLLSAPYSWSAPGMSESNFDLEEIFAGNFRKLGVDTTMPGQLIPVHNKQWGAGTATAGSKIHITRIIYLGTLVVSSGSIMVPPSAVLLPITLMEEKDLVYMERLRRSYVLAESR